MKFTVQITVKSDETRLNSNKGTKSDMEDVW
jgi:hypothetical protein